ncbi:MAG: ABC-F family ATP-binding cassette domain-containing protein [Cyclobacteriaceae bacterium]|nr:ABC-F family ATP-binding cassette domain-containing protein [Cyclobacteriaceae bacterium]
MLSINNLTYHIGGRTLFENASLHIRPRDKIGLIGLNGKGKTTLLRLIAGEYQVDGGDISYSKECTLGFLNQDMLSYESEKSILNVAMEAFGEALVIKEKLDRILTKLESEYSDKLVEQLTSLQEEFERLEGYVIQSKTEEILEGIGFSTADIHKPLRTFSGGWRMRVMLAKLLLEKPSLLMLDEPTNHLDLPSIEWVENYLRNYEGAIIVVSHDREFLDNTISKTVEVDNNQLVVYEGNYAFYKEEKILRREIQENTYQNQQQQIKQTERFIERFRAKSTKAKQVQSRVKALDRMDKVEKVEDSNAAINFRFSLKTRSGKQVLELKDVSKAFGDHIIFDKTTAHINRGDKIALIGANGKGKSTLLRIIAGSEKIVGERKEGHNVIKGFYAQHQLEALHVDNELLEELKQSGSGKTEQELRNVLGCFLFSDDDVFKKIKVLSGGEKSRVALAQTLISEANFLLLDEPTNHLDFISENILIQALQQYEGTYIIVSHNRHFITQVANKIWYIEDQQVKEYPGTFEEYLYWQHNLSSKSEKQTEKQVEKPGKAKKGKKVRENNTEQRDSKKKVEVLENEIMLLEEEKEVLETAMAKPDVVSNPEELQKFTQKLMELNSLLDEKTEVWEKLLSEQ